MSSRLARRPTVGLVVPHQCLSRLADVVGGGLSEQAYALETDPEDDADINEDAFDWNGDFQVRTCVLF